MKTDAGKLILIQMNTSKRLERILDYCLEDVETEAFTTPGFAVERLAHGKFHNCRILFAVYVDQYGAPEEFHSIVRALRIFEDALSGCTAGLIVDGESELYTKAAAQELALAVTNAGGRMPGKALVEGTGSLYNQHILAKRYGLGPEETYRHRCRLLVQQILEFEPPRKKEPRLLVIHASEKSSSSTMWLADKVIKALPDQIRVEEISLQNGTIQDCRGCGYEACLHFSTNRSCFYGGTIPAEILPAIENCDAMLFLCPNYNDAISANIMALINRMTSLVVREGLENKQVFGIVVSGYSGGDLVARQLFGAMCLNKPGILPPYACMLQTANDLESIKEIFGIEWQAEDFAEHIADAILEQEV